MVSRKGVRHRAVMRAKWRRSLLRSRNKTSGEACEVLYTITKMPLHSVVESTVTCGDLHSGGAGPLYRLWRERCRRANAAGKGNVLIRALGPAARGRPGNGCITRSSEHCWKRWRVSGRVVVRRNGCAGVIITHGNTAWWANRSIPHI